MRLKKIGIVFLLIIMLFSVSGCNKQDYLKTILLFDTSISLKMYDITKSQYEEYTEVFSQQMEYYHKLFDKYNSYTGLNNIKTINDNAGIESVEVERPIIELLLLAKEYYHLTNGAFDITMGNLLNTWHEYRENGLLMNNEECFDVPLPSINELENSKHFSGWEFVEINEEKNTVFITNTNVSIDVGAIAKGYACEKVSQSLIEHGLVYGYINGGGNIRTIGEKKDGSNWRIGIANPNDPLGASIHAIDILNNNSVVTSGDYQRYFISNGKKYNHIINPLSLYPADNHRSVTIVSNDSAIADILSTSLFVMTYEEGLEFLERYNKIYPNTINMVVWVYDINLHPLVDGVENTNCYIITYNN